MKRPHESKYAYAIKRAISQLELQRIEADHYVKNKKTL